MSWSSSRPHPGASAGGVRRAAVAGTFYPAHPQRLREQVRRHLQAAEPPALPGRVRAVIAPHAGYVYSGPVAAYSFRALPALAGRTVFLLGPAHFVPVEGAAAATFQAMQTPLGQAPVSTELVEALAAESADVYFDDDAHGPEHSLEVELPFMQVLAGAAVQVAPLLLGAGRVEALAQVMAVFIARDPASLVVVSSDLSHFHPYDEARRRDLTFLDAVVRGDLPAIARGEACGRQPILLLALLAQHFGWQAHLLDYRNSGDTAGDRRRVVGYGAVAYTEAGS